MYLYLKDFDHLRDHPSVRFRSEIVNGVDVTIICYMISDDALWSLPLGVECRGIVFDTETGDLIGLPFEKFFNVGEKAHTQPYIVRHNDLMYAADKMDGSMIHPVIIGGKVHFKTKKSFNSDVAVAATKNAPKWVIDISGHLLSLGFSPIFEYTDPDWKIVLDYGVEPKFTLLAIRDMENGDYLDMDNILEYLDTYPEKENVNLVSYTNTSMDDCLEKAKTASGIEGWVLYTDGGRYKIKTDWYIERHRVIDLRERDVARMVLDDTIDDIKPLMIAGGVDMTKVHEIESIIVAGIADIYSTAVKLAEVAKTFTDPRERAEWVKQNCHENAGFVFRLARGNEVSEENLKEFYSKHHIKDFSLRSLVNNNFDGA